MIPVGQVRPARRLGGFVRLALSVALLVVLASAAEASARPKLPTDLGGAQQLEVRPYVVAFTGDGTGFFGGFTGRSAVRQPSRVHLRWAGRIHWAVWNGNQAKGTGAAWLNDGNPFDAAGTFHPFPVSLHAFRSRHGLFTRLAYRYIYQGTTYSGTLNAHFVPASQLGPSYWAWPGG